jgi:hypothetical protein
LRLGDQALHSGRQALLFGQQFTVRANNCQVLATTGPSRPVPENRHGPSHRGRRARPRTPGPQGRVGRR